MTHPTTEKIGLPGYPQSGDFYTDSVSARVASRDLVICTATRRLCGLRKDQLREDELVRIALIAPPWLPVPPPSYGGVEAVVDRLARGFDAAGDATAAGARLRMVQDGLTGFVRDRPEDLVEAVHRIPEIARDACRKAVEADFSTARMVRDRLNFFEDLGGRTPSPTP